MDPRAEELLEAALLLFEAEKTSLMQERLRADEAALRAKERELSMLITEKDRALGLKEAGETLVDAFHQLQANGDMDPEDETAMMQAIAAWMNNFGDAGVAGL